MERISLFSDPIRRAVHCFISGVNPSFVHCYEILQKNPGFLNICKQSADVCDCVFYLLLANAAPILRKVLSCAIHYAK